MARNVFLYVFFGAILFGCVVFIVLSMTLQRYVPNDLNTTKWSEFTQSRRPVSDSKQVLCCSHPHGGSHFGNVLLLANVAHYENLLRILAGIFLWMFFVCRMGVHIVPFLSAVRSERCTEQCSTACFGKKTTGKSHDRDCNSLFIDATTSNQSAGLFSVRCLQEGIHDGLYDSNICHDVEECDYRENVDSKSIIHTRYPSLCDFIFPGTPNTFDDLFFVERFFVAEEHGCIARRFRTYK